MDKKSFKGKTLMYAARALGFCAKGYRVYILRDAEDQIGRLAATDYELERILRDHPELKHCRVISAEEYYGIRIFRVASKEAARHADPTGVCGASVRLPG